jgi:general secretion pathway protein D
MRKISFLSGFNLTGPLCLGISFISLFLYGCPKSQDNLKYAREAERLQDFDLAAGFYEREAQTRPHDAHVRISLARMRSAAGMAHLEKGRKFAAQHWLEGAVQEFKNAVAVDPSNQAARQELIAALSMLEMPAAPESKLTVPSDQPSYSDRPPELKVLPKYPINLRMTNDARTIYETVCKLAGLSVIFDPDFPSRRISVELNNVTLDDALDIVSIESKAFWKPLAQNVVWILPDQPQKRRDYEDQVLQTFYLSNVSQPQDVTEIVTGLRQLLDLKRIQQLNGQNAIMIRDTPSKLAAAKVFIENVDRAKPEVLIDVQVLQARTDLIRKLGVNPGTSVSLAFNNGCTSSSSSSCSSSSSSTSSSTTNFTLQDLKHLSAADYNVTLPGASLTALLTDTLTQIIQNPEIRSVDGQTAKLKVGDRVPVATGSYQSGVAATTTSVSSLVNTQYQYLDVGVNVDVTPHVHPNHEVSMKVAIEVSSVTGYSTIGGLQEPIISQRKIEHEIRLKEGEVSILGGLFERTDTKSKSGWPGVSNVPFLSYLTSEKDKETQENEVLIVLTPHIVRLSEISAANLKALYTGSESNIQLKPVYDKEAGLETLENGQTVQGTATGKNQGAITRVHDDKSVLKGSLLFESPQVNLHVGESSLLKLDVREAKDLFTAPIIFQYDPKVMSVEEVRHGTFFSDGGQEIAVVQQIDQERGIANITASRPPRSAGVNGDGTLLEITVRALGAGRSDFTIVEANAKNSKHGQLELGSAQTTVSVSQ